jgi:hypothetical protein
MRDIWIINGATYMDKDGIVVAVNVTEAEMAAALREGRVRRDD